MNPPARTLNGKALSLMLIKTLRNDRRSARWVTTPGSPEFERIESVQRAETSRELIADAVALVGKAQSVDFGASALLSLLGLKRTC